MTLFCHVVLQVAMMIRLYTMSLAAVPMARALVLPYRNAQIRERNRVRLAWYVMLCYTNICSFMLLYCNAYSISISMLHYVMLCYALRAQHNRQHRQSAIKNYETVVRSQNAVRLPFADINYNNNNNNNNNNNQDVNNSNQIVFETHP